LQQGPACQDMDNLGARGFHAPALAGGKNDDAQWHIEDSAV